MQFGDGGDDERHPPRPRFYRRTDFLKFAGCYHGHSDGLLVAAGSGALTIGVPDSPGVPPAYAQHTLTAPYNDIAALEQVFAAHGERLAAVIVEPVAGNMSCVPPDPAFFARAAPFVQQVRHGADF